MLRRRPRAPERRPGQILVLFVLVLSALLGLLGLVLDGGLIMASHRQAQNAADTAALAAAMELMRGNSASGAQSMATTFVKTYNGLSNATVTVTAPPATGPYAGNSRYAEA